MGVYMANKTIKDLANELDVSKSYIDKIIRILGMQTELSKVGNKYVINKKQEKAILSRISSSGTNTKSHTKSTTESTSEVDFLRQQIIEKNEEMKQMQKLLDQQQQLTLQANSQIQQLQEQLALTHEQSDIEEKESNEEIKDEVPKVENEDKKWWHFLKR